MPINYNNTFDANLPMTDAANLKFLSFASALSYLRPEEVTQNFTDVTRLPPSADKTLTRWTNKTGNIEISLFDYGGSTQVYMIKDYEHGNLFVVPRGTEPGRVADIAADINPRIDQQGRQEGFENALQEKVNNSDMLHKIANFPNGGGNGETFITQIKAEAGAFTQKQQAEGKQANIFLTGHSLGGALAELTGLEMDKDGLPVKGVVTFGAPAVGNTQFAEKSNRQLGTRHVRISAVGDIIPELGAQLKQSTRGFYFDRDQPLNSDITTEEWSKRYANSYVVDAVKERFKEHSSYNSYHSIADALATKQNVVLTTQTSAVVNHFKEQGFTQDSLRTTPGDPEIGTLLRMINNNKDELIGPKISESAFNSQFNALKAQATQHPEFHIRESIDRPVTAPSPYGFSTLKNEYAAQHPGEIFSHVTTVAGAIANNKVAAAIPLVAELSHLTGSALEITGDVIKDGTSATMPREKLAQLRADADEKKTQAKNTVKETVDWTKDAVKDLAGWTKDNAKDLAADIARPGLSVLPTQVQTQIKEAAALPSHFSPTSIISTVAATVKTPGKH